MFVSLCRYAFGHASTYGAETWHGGRVWRAGGNCQLFVATRQVKGHLEVNLFRNTLWLPNLVGRSPDQSECTAGVKGHAGVIRGQPGVKLLRNALWPPKLVERIPGQTKMHCWSQRSCRGQLGSSRGQLAQKCRMATKFGGKNPWPERNALLGSKVM